MAQRVINGRHERRAGSRLAASSALVLLTLTGACFAATRSAGDPTLDFQSGAATRENAAVAPTPPVVPAPTAAAALSLPAGGITAALSAPAATSAPVAPAVAATAPVAPASTAPAVAEIAPATQAPAENVPSAPAQAVINFYNAVVAGQYESAARLWSPRMLATYPPAENITRRFSQTRSLTVQRAEIVSFDEAAGRAVVIVQLEEVVGTPPVTHLYGGSWQVVRSPAGWLLDQPDVRVQ